jgi:hypothetical protein
VPGYVGIVITMLFACAAQAFASTQSHSHCVLLNMPIVVEPSYHISLDEKATWVVRPDMLIRVEDQTFVRLTTWDRSLISIITNIAGVDLPTKCRPSLAGCPGYQSLKSLRNASLTANDDEATAANALFGDSAAATLKAKAPRISRAAMAELRSNPQVTELTIQVSGRAPLSLLVLKPGHSNEDMSVHLEPDTLDYVFTYIAEQGVAIEDLLAKRQYGGDHGPGVWRMGSAGLVRKIDAVVDDDDDESPTKKHAKYQSLTTKSKQTKLSDMFGRSSSVACEESPEISQLDEFTDVA